MASLLVKIFPTPVFLITVDFGVGSFHSSWLISNLLQTINIRWRLKHFQTMYSDYLTKLSF